MLLGRLVEGLVFELKPGDPRVLAAAAALLALTAIGGGTRSGAPGGGDGPDAGAADRVVTVIFVSAIS